MLNATVLKESLTPALIAFWNTCREGDQGMTIEEYADQFSAIIAEKVIQHIQQNAVVNTILSGYAGEYPITGTGQGGVS